MMFQNLFMYPKLDYILHLHLRSAPSNYLKIPIRSLKVGSLGTYNLLGLTKNKNVTHSLIAQPLRYTETEY